LLYFPFLSDENAFDPIKLQQELFEDLVVDRHEITHNLLPLAKGTLRHQEEIIRVEHRRYLLFVHLLKDLVLCSQASKELSQQFSLDSALSH
jgi:hypothetical protein